MPEGAIYVGRPTKWGNPFIYRSDDPAHGGLVRYRPSNPDYFEYEGRISRDGMRHDYWGADGTVTEYWVRYATRLEIVELFRRTLLGPDRGMVGAWPSRGGHFARFGILDVQHELRGRDLACWCPLDQPCHADVLLQIANEVKEA
jgi:hypothetical protein